MNERSATNHGEPCQSSASDFLGAAGSMPQRIRAFDWRATALGPLEHWPRSLKIALTIALNSRHPIWMGWGRELINLYNDAYIPVLGKRDEWALGAPARTVWSEIWQEHLGEQAEAVLLRGEASWNEQRQLVLYRNGYAEETYFTYSFSPLPSDAGGIGGLFCACLEQTERVLGERRLATLSHLAAETAEARTEQQAIQRAARVLSAHNDDVAFALLYLIGSDGTSARLAACTANAHGAAWAPEAFALPEGGAGDAAGPWPLAGAGPQGVQVLRRLDPQRGLPGGRWPEPASSVAIVPLPKAGEDRQRGFLIVGASPRLPFDARYQSFFELLARGIADALANARAYEHEKRRAEALAQLDRAKTRFFSNVSHEFRTPLALMLGPVEDLLDPADAALSAGTRRQLELIRRNGLRLLKLVNSLLDFSRIEAGRMQANYQPLDLCAYTAELASTFRSAIERAGLRLIIDCPPMRTQPPAYIDRDMWEKIVLNLLSNAFKFTLAGEIEVAVRSADAQAWLTVRDSGVGIPAEELPRMFERFHRVAGSRGRTHEGTGIGLALVQELVRLHGGSVSVQSVPNEGSRFTVGIPLGRAHLDPAHIQQPAPLAFTRTSAESFVEEALRWLPDAARADESSWERSLREASLAAPISLNAGARARIVLADDNADMRDYVVRLLRDRFEVEAVADGEAALATVRARPPDLVLGDVMMPRLDGVGLLRAIRSDPALGTLPVILLSARAGEEARIEGARAGADDYLVKPFSARELIARLEVHIRMAQLRRETEQALKDANERKDEFLATLAHELRNPLAPLRNALFLLRTARTDATSAAILDVLERQIDHMVRLVDDLLEVSRITRGAIRLQMQRVDMAAVVGQAIDTARPLIQAARHQLSVQLPPAPLPVDVDPVRFAQIVGNLINNAAKYTEPGGHIWVSAARRDEQALVSVRDDGIGIQPAMLSRIFEMFTQIDRDHKMAQGGLGIGLALVKRLVEMHGGQVLASSAGLGQGSEFCVSVPLARASAAVMPESAPAAGALNARGQRLLVVDDNQDSAATLAMLLQFYGCEVRTANDGHTALRMLQSYHPSLIILDLGMPGMSGFELARHLRALPEGPSLRLVALTGWGQEADRQRSREAGFDYHVVKPVDLKTLEQLLQNRPPEGVVRRPPGAAPLTRPTSSLPP